MHFAKIKNTILDGSEPFAGIVVASEDFYTAHCFSQDGYDEGELAGHTMVPVEVRIERGATYDDVFAAARAIGISPVDGDDAPNALILEPKVLAELQRMGFDGYADVEVISNTQNEVLTVWDISQVSILSEPADKADFSVTESPAGNFLVKAETVRGRERIRRAMDAYEGRDDEEAATILASEGVLPGFSVKGEIATDAAGNNFELERFGVQRLTDEGEFSMTEVEPAARPRF